MSTITVTTLNLSQDPPPSVDSALRMDSELPSSLEEIWTFSKGAFPSGGTKGEGK